MSLAEIERAFAQARDKTVLVVGEAITDEYVYVSPLYKPSKELVLAMAVEGVEVFAGGIDAAGAHLKGWCEVSVLRQSEPIRKRRYVERGFNRKLFETYSPASLVLSGTERASFNRLVRTQAEKADVVVVIDFGHGLIDQECREILQHAKYLALNCQSNAGNHGFNPVTKYKTADYVCVDFQEARLAVQMQHEALETVIERLSDRMGCKTLIVTEGRSGASWRGGHVSAMTERPVDTMGAGDCFLAITAPLLACGLSVAESAFVGTVAAGMKTAIVGHRKAVSPEVVLKTVQALRQ